MAPKHLQRRYVAYYRVSTQRQGRSGLGLDAQRRAVADFLLASGGTLQAEFAEIQSGSDDARPKLAEALRLCRLTHTTLLIAKLDRLSRNAAFLLQLQSASVRIVAVDMPDMDERLVGIMAVLAQAERKAISERTIAALKAAKARGVRLGNPRLQPGTAATAKIASTAAMRAAKKRAEDLRDTVEDARQRGCGSLRALAAHLNSVGYPTPRGSSWEATSVKRLLKQLAA